ncbi:MAG: hypothetical protein VYE15_00235 [Myxococcota bacterium]|nr:hypothetical protein [Myxococcota bacterium]
MNHVGRRGWVFLGALLALSALVGCDPVDPTDPDALDFVELDDAVLYDCDGEEVSLLDWVKAHEVSYIGFASGWCGACKEEVPVLNEELVAPNDPQKVGVAQILLEDENGEPATAALCAGWRDGFGANYTILSDIDQVLLEPFFGGGPIEQLPVHLIVTGDGLIRYQLAANLPSDIAQRVTSWLPPE